MSNDLGNYLRKLRGKRSLRDIAEKTGLSHTYIADVESGFRRGTNKPLRPSPETLKKFSEALDASYVELMVLAGYWDDDELLHPIEWDKENPDPVGALESGLKAKVPVEELLDWVTLTRGGKVLDRDTASKALDLLLKALDMMEN